MMWCHEHNLAYTHNFFILVIKPTSTIYLAFFRSKGVIFSLKRIFWTTLAHLFSVVLYLIFCKFFGWLFGSIQSPRYLVISSFNMVSEQVWTFLYLFQCWLVFSSWLFTLVYFVIKPWHTKESLNQGVFGLFFMVLMLVGKRCFVGATSVVLSTFFRDFVHKLQHPALGFLC